MDEFEIDNYEDNYEDENEYISENDDFKKTDISTIYKEEEEEEENLEKSDFSETNSSESEEEVPILEPIPKKYIFDKNTNELINKIKNYKLENNKKFSPLGVISLMCQVNQFIKFGGKLINIESNHEYPNITEESYTLEAILLKTHPFIYHINNKEIKIDQKIIMLLLKILLRGIDDNKIFFTKHFKEKFPNFIKNLYNDEISEIELEEVDNLKSKIINSL